jgi:HlyD family secretion protein
VAHQVQKGAASQSELERLNAERDAALARNVASKERHAQAAAHVEDAVYNLSRTTLTSPIEGTVIELSREVGERVRGSDFSEDVVMVIAALTAMDVRIEAGEHEVIHLKAGQKAEITVDAFEGQVFSGTVVEIAQRALIKNQGSEAEVTSFPVTVALDSRPPGALPGMSSEVRIATETHEDAIIVPVQAITARSEKSLSDSAPPVAAEGKALTVKRRAESLVKVAFVVDAEQRVHPRRVKTGIASDADLEILEGLADGDRVVEGPYRTLSKELKDKDLVREEEPSKGPGSKSGHGRRSL